MFLDLNDLSLLQGLLESILKVKIHKIEIQNSELNEGNAFFRRKNLDALLETNEGIINIEINTSVDDYLKERNFAFIMKAFTNYTLRGEDYDKEEQFIQINFNYNTKDKEYSRIYYVQDEKQKQYVSNVKIYEFNIDKYVNLWYTNDKEKIEENKYLIMMNLPKKELEKFSKKDKVVSKYMYKLNRINEDPAFLNLIDYEQDNRMIENTLKKRAWKRGLEEGREKGLKIGREEGKKEGKKEGREEGREKGREEATNHIAKSLLSSGMSFAEVSKHTGISLEVLKRM